MRSGGDSPLDHSICALEPGAFAIEKPTTTRWPDVWGTVWDPQTGLGGNL